MFSAIGNFIAIVKALIDLWRYWQKFQEAQKVAEAAQKKKDREKAIEDLKNAKTEQEIWDAQDRIVKSKP